LENELEIMRLVRKEALAEITKPSVIKAENTDDSSEISASANISAQAIFAARNEVLNTYMSPEIERYLVEIITATRTPERYSDELARLLTWGASPRASLALDRCARARAWLHERDFVTPEDLQDLTGDVLRHRIIESYEAESDGITPDDVINKILALVPVP
jgi:MoxR-like ATPase